MSETSENSEDDSLKTDERLDDFDDDFSPRSVF